MSKEAEQQQINSRKRSTDQILAAELSWKLKSKDDFYVYLDKHLQYYLPPKNQVNKDFLKQIFTEEKKLLQKRAVTTIEVPRYDELSVR